MLSAVDYRVETDRLPNGDLRPRIVVSSSKLNTLRAALLLYWRWCAEGRVPYYTSAERNQPKQYYYDRYHARIDFDPTANLYVFDIQTDDGPDGDTWWRGEFRLPRGLEIEIVEERYSGH